MFTSNKEEKKLAKLFDIANQEVFVSSEGQKVWEELLILAKRKLNVSPDKPVFMGMKNFSEYYWCAMQSLLQAKEDELMFFQACIMDSVGYAKELGILKDKIKTLIDLLNVDDLIKFCHFEALFKRAQQDFVTPEMEEEWKKDPYIKEALQGTEELNAIPVDASPFEKGVLFESTKGEHYPKLRWHFRNGNFVLIGIPDGITDKIVYEFKSMKTKGYMPVRKPVAECQADLYGYFFKRDIKRLQYHFQDTDEIQTSESPIDKERVEKTFAKYQRLVDGELPIKPLSWKCKSCKYADRCPLNNK
jgi:hypothetical protein